MDPDTVAAPDAAERLLAQLVGDPRRFAEEHWGRAPLLRRGVREQAPPLTVDDVDHLVTSSGLRWPALRLVRDGSTLPVGAYTRSGRVGGKSVTDLVDGERALAHFDEGATLVLQGLHRYHPPVTELCERLQTALGHPVQANAYLTPPGSRGLNVHHDTHDVLALQTHGHKHWVVHEPAVAVPLPSQPWSADTHEPGPLLLDVELAPGDLLYLPRGTPHAAETVGEVSLHLTIGVRVVTWYDVAQRAARRLADDPELREALPLGFARGAEHGALEHDTLGDLAAEAARRLQRAASGMADVAVDELVDDLVAEQRRQRRPHLRGRLADLVFLDKVDDDTRVRRREALAIRVDEVDDRVVLRLPDREVSLPAAARGVLTALLDGRTHRVGDLADRLDEESRSVLVRRLLREGALATAGPERG